MSGMRSFFISAPKIRLKIGGGVIAHAIGLSINVDVNVEQVFTFSRYDSANPEALQYGLVSGSLQIVKLASSTSNSTLQASATSDPGSTVLADHLDPSRILASETFDLEILVNHSDQLASADPTYSLYTVKDCRLGGTNINISLGALVNEPMSFQGLLLLDSDTNGPDAGTGQAYDNAVKDGF
jgi:hypothetical protein